MEKAADAADMSVLFFLAGANFLGPERGKLCVKSALLTVLSAPELSA